MARRIQCASLELSHSFLVWINFMHLWSFLRFCSEWRSGKHHCSKSILWVQWKHCKCHKVWSMQHWHGAQELQYPYTPACPYQIGISCWTTADDTADFPLMMPLIWRGKVSDFSSCIAQLCRTENMHVLLCDKFYMDVTQVLRQSGLFVMCINYVNFLHHLVHVFTQE